MKDGIGGPTHGNVKPHGIQEGFFAGYASGQNGSIPLEIILMGIFDNDTGGLPEQVQAEGMGSQDGAVAGQGKTDGFIQAVHGIGGKHPGA
jgi:hypothetical protein